MFLALIKLLIFILSYSVNVFLWNTKDSEAFRGSMYSLIAYVIM